MKSRKIIGIAALILMAACTSEKEKRQEAVRDLLRKTVVTNQTSVGHGEWESSEFHSESLFWRWAREHQSPDEICPALLELSDEKLTICEEEIKRPEYQHLVRSCREKIEERLREYWKIQTESLANVNMDFRFEGGSVLRDFSEGLFVVAGDLKPREVILTFDDGPHSAYTDQILQTLEQTNVKAIFFEMGRSIRENPEQVRHVAAGGHLIGSHSVSHRCLAFKKVCEKSNHGQMLSYGEAIYEISSAHQMIQDLLGWVDPYFRFPFGESSTELRNYLSKNSMGEFNWSIDSKDWRAQSPSAFIQSVMTDVTSRGRGIILFHDVQHRTAVTLPSILRRLYDEGFKPVVIRPADPNARFTNKIVKHAGQNQ